MPLLPNRQRDARADINGEGDNEDDEDDDEGANTEMTEDAADERAEGNSLKKDEMSASRSSPTSSSSSSSWSSPLVGVLHEGSGLNGRASTVTAFRRGQCCVLLATDLAARGLDVPETSHVVQVSM